MMQVIFCGSDEPPEGFAYHDDHCAGFPAHTMERNGEEYWGLTPGKNGL